MDDVGDKPRVDEAPAAVPPVLQQALERVLAGRGEGAEDVRKAALAAGVMGDLTILTRVLGMDPGLDRHGVAEHVASYGMNAGSMACIEWLLDHGVDIRRTSKNGWNLAHSCALSGTLEMMRMLVRRGVDLHGSHLGSHRPVHKSLLNKDPAMLAYFLDEVRVDPDLTNYDGMTLLDHALEDRRADLADLLKSRGAGKKGMHLVVPRPLRLGERRYRRSLLWHAQNHGSKVGPAPKQFVAWMREQKLPDPLVALMSELMPTEPIEYNVASDGLGDELFAAEQLMQQCEWQPELVEAGLLPIASMWHCGDLLVVDLKGGGRAGHLSHEVRSLNPRTGFRGEYAATLGEAVRKVVGAPWRPWS